MVSTSGFATLLGNITIKFETSLFTWKDQYCIKHRYYLASFKVHSDVSKLITIFPSEYRRFQVDIVISNLILVYKLIIFPSDVSKLSYYQVKYYQTKRLDLDKGQQ